MKRNKWTLAGIALMLITAAACEKDDLNTTVPPNPPTDPNWGTGDSVPIVSPYYFQGKVDSIYYVFQDDVFSYFNTVDSVLYAPCGSTQNLVGQTTRLGRSSDLLSLEIRFLNCLQDTADSMINAAALFEGTYAYGNSALNQPIGGIEVVWTDADGQEWKSKPGTGSAANYSFEILRYDTVPSWDSLADAYVIGLMDVSLFRGSQSIPIEAGEFRLRIGKF